MVFREAYQQPLERDGINMTNKVIQQEFSLHMNSIEVLDYTTQHLGFERGKHLKPQQPKLSKDELKQQQQE